MQTARKICVSFEFMIQWTYIHEVIFTPDGKNPTHPPQSLFISPARNL